MKKAIAIVGLVLIIGLVVGMTPASGDCGFFDEVGRSFLFQPYAKYSPHPMDNLPSADNHVDYFFKNVTSTQKFTGVCYYLGPDNDWKDYWSIVQFCFSDACYFPGVPGQTGSPITAGVKEMMTAQFGPPGKSEDAKFGKFGTGKVEVYPSDDESCKDTMYIAGVHLPFTCIKLVIDDANMSVAKCTEWRLTGDRQNRYPMVEKNVTLDQPATIDNSRTYIPLRALADEIYSTVGWDGATRTASFTISEGDCYYKMALQIDNATATCTLKAGDGKILTDKVKMSAPAIIKNGRTLVPVRSLGEDLMGGEILWDGDAREVTLYMPPREDH
jgi:hypothetical protein